MNESKMVYVLGIYGHRLCILGVFGSYEAAVKSIRDELVDEGEIEEDDEDWEPSFDSYYIEEFELEGTK